MIFTNGSYTADVSCDGLSRERSISDFRHSLLEALTQPTSPPLAGNSGHLTWVSRKRHCHQFLPTSSMCSSFRVSVSKRQASEWLSLRFGIFDGAQMHAIAHGGLCERRKRICTKRWLWEKQLLPHRGLEPVLVLRLAFRSDRLYSVSYATSWFKHKFIRVHVNMEKLNYCVSV